MTSNKRIIIVLVIISALFLSLAVYLTVFELTDAQNAVNSPYNRRVWETEDSVIRGSIVDRTGVVLATSDGGERKYKGGGIYTHVIGRNSRTYGKTGLELNFNNYLLNDGYLGLNTAENSKGSTLNLTLDDGFTRLANDLMNGSSGAVVALDPKTGEVLCLLSRPYFDSTESALLKNWDALTSRGDAPFVARATQGLYAPGSTFKTVTAAAAINAGKSGFKMLDEGSITIDGMEIKNYGSNAYGELDLTAAFAKSSNVYFAALATQLGESRIRSTVSDFGIGEAFDFDVPLAASRFNYDKMGEVDLAAVGIGQGKLLVTPLDMALAAASIANGGVSMKPYLVSSAIAQNGRRIYSASPKKLRRTVSAKTADALKDIMIACVETGTASGAKIDGVSVAAKTGTAQNEKEGSEHAWFICFAPADDPEIAIAIVKEYSGETGSSLAPVAKRLIKYWLER